MRRVSDNQIGSVWSGRADWQLSITRLLPADDMSTSSGPTGGQQTPGATSILPKEHGAFFYSLPFIRNSEKEVRVGWDLSTCECRLRSKYLWMSSEV